MLEVSGIANKEKNLFINEQIRAKEVMVIGPSGEQLGTKALKDALTLATYAGFDLVLINETSNPPVCKLLNYGKYRFEAKKRAKEAKKNQKIIEIKEIQLTPQIGEHDIQTKVTAAIKFLADGNKVKVGVRFKGRQLAHPEVGEETLNKFINYVKDEAIIEKQPVLDGKWLTCVLAKKNKK